MPKTITKPVVEVETCNDNPTTGFRFHHADTTFTDVNFLSCTESNLTKLCGNFIGLFCSWNKASNGQIDNLNGCGPIYDGQPFQILPFSNVFYAVGSPNLDTSSYSSNLESCRPHSYAVHYKNAEGSTIGKPSWLTSQPPSKNFIISTSDLSDIGVVTVVLTATTDLMIPDLSTPPSWNVISPATT